MAEYSRHVHDDRVGDKVSGAIRLEARRISVLDQMRKRAVGRIVVAGIGVGEVRDKP